MLQYKKPSIKVIAKINYGSGNSTSGSCTNYGTGCGDDVAWDYNPGWGHGNGTGWGDLTTDSQGFHDGIGNGKGRGDGDGCGSGYRDGDDFGYGSGCRDGSGEDDGTGRG